MSSIVSLFPSPVLVEVLALFLTHPQEHYYQRSIAEKTQHSLSQVQYALERIEASGLVTKEKSGNRVYYKANIQHPAFNGFKEAFMKTVCISDPFKNAILPLAKEIQIAFIYGSIAQGKETSESDVDILIIGDIRTKKLIQHIGSLALELGREINPVVFPLEEFQNILKKGLESHPFIGRVVKEPKIWLIGNEDDLAKMVG
ncbi:MAG: nucleotidyltransferase domain-containing protein [Cyanobacteria bacterium]|nr:nucleotidyltransferase domain-containing protein [Cyanobacteriota bacterium]